MPTETGIDIDAEYQRAEQAIQINRPDVALQAMTRVLSVDPHDANAYLLMTRAHMVKGELDVALETIQKTMALAPNFDFGYALHGYLLWQKNNKAAEPSFQKALELNPNSRVAHDWYGSYLLENRRVVEADHHARQALAIDPRNTDGLALMGHVLAEQGKLDEAETCFKQALALEPDEFEVHNSYGVFLLTHRNEPKRAFDYFREAIRMSPNNQNVRHNFLLTLKARHPLYGVFWNWSLMLDRLGRGKWVVVIGIYLVMQVFRQMVKFHPELWPVAVPVIVLYVLFCLYTWTADPIFSFLVKRGWIR